MKMTAGYLSVRMACDLPGSGAEVGKIKAEDAAWVGEKPKRQSVGDLGPESRSRCTVLRAAERDPARTSPCRAPASRRLDGRSSGRQVGIPSHHRRCIAVFHLHCRVAAPFKSLVAVSRAVEAISVDVVFILLIVVPVVLQLRRTRRREAAALANARRAGASTDGPRAQHPRIDLTHCIGCGACTEVCPEGDVLGLIGGKAAIVHAAKCVGHGLCAEACPVGAIEIVMANPSVAADLPQLSPEQESSVPGLFIVGELGGLALIKNAVNQGRDCIDVIAERLVGARRAGLNDPFDVCIVGAGPAGISASLRAVERRLRYVTLEQDELGGTVAKYPRQKLVMTSPVEFPLHGKLRKLEVSKEELLGFWTKAVRESGLQVRAHERVEDILREDDGTFTVITNRDRYPSRHVILALGRRGTPRKLGIPGEELPKVMYSLLDAEAYRDARILVVGGGDSAAEAAMGLAYQRGNRVTLAYRGQAFHRLKDRNARKLDDAVATGRLTVLLECQPTEVRPHSVLLTVAGQPRELENDYVWIFAGGTSPSAFLEKIGVRMGSRDLTAEVEQEAAAALTA